MFLRSIQYTGRFDNLIAMLAKEVQHLLVEHMSKFNDN